LEREIQNLENELETATKDLLSTMRKPSRLDEDLNDDMEKLWRT